MRTLLLLPLLLFVAFAPPQESSAACALTRRVAVIGASVSAGFGLENELKAEAAFGDVLDCALVGERDACTDLGEIFFFRDPWGRGPEQVEQALAIDPTLVVGIDFLFWFAYGSYMQGAQRRLAELERGLALLERFDCPLLIGDLPDMRIALEGEGPFGGPLITERMIPTPEELETLNARIREWAGERGDVSVVPLAEFLRRANAGEKFSLRDNEWGEGSLRSLLQKDLLHPKAGGVIVLIVIALDRLELDREDFSGEHALWTARSIHERLLDATAAEREKTLEVERRRAERARRREERRKEREKTDGGGGGDGGNRPSGQPPTDGTRPSSTSFSNPAASERAAAAVNSGGTSS